MQAVGQARSERRDFGGVHYAGSRVDVEPDGQVQGRDRDALCLLDNIQSPLGLGQSHLGTEHLLALDDAPLGQLLGHVQIIVGATHRLLGDAVQRPDAQHLVVGRRNFVGDGLIGALGLQLGDIGGEAPPGRIGPSADRSRRSAIAASIPPARNQIWMFRPTGIAPPAGQKVERRRVRESWNWNTRPAHVQTETPNGIARGYGRQECRIGDLLTSLSLFDAFQRCLKPRLMLERQSDRVGQRQSLAGPGASSRVRRRHRQLGLRRTDLLSRLIVDQCH